MEIPLQKQSLLNLMKNLADGRVFVSMPVTPLTPKYFLTHQGVRKFCIQQGIERRHGILRFDECSLSCFDHGNLYGDGVFEGILITNGHVYKLKEHLSRLRRSADAIGIRLPYSPHQFAEYILATAKDACVKKKDTAYIRLVVTRGIGNLGIDPRKCIAPTVYIIVSQITLYPWKFYKTGIHLAAAKNIRRPEKSTLDPTVKSLNYLNNVQAVREGVISNKDSSVMEVLMLTYNGYVSEASADNIFIVNHTLSGPFLYTPADEYALIGITRQTILSFAHKLSIPVVKSSTILPEDLLGKDKEVFLTGTAAGVIPVVKFDGQPIGRGIPGPITKKMIALHKKDQKNLSSGLSLKATRKVITRYLCS